MNVHVARIFDPVLLEECRLEFPDTDRDGWRKYSNQREAKYEGPPVLWGPNTVTYFEQLSSLGVFYANSFGLPELHMETVGGGYHLIPPGGYLNVHTDFSRSPQTGRYRRLNVLTYLNHDWTDPGGHLELWNDTECVRSIAPEFGVTVAFVTSNTSWHGHPKPASRWRASLAAYFYTDTAPDQFEEQSTVWHPKGV